MVSIYAHARVEGQVNDELHVRGLAAGQAWRAHVRILSSRMQRQFHPLACTPL
jgi:hypothetical protein